MSAIPVSNGVPRLQKQERPKPRRSAGRRLFAALLCLSLCGCQSLILAVDKNGDAIAAWWNSRASRPEELSDVTWELLRYWDLDSRYVQETDATLAHLAGMFHERPRREWACSLAELSWHAGRRAEQPAKSFRMPGLPGEPSLVAAEMPDPNADAARHYLNAVSYAHYFLVTAEVRPNIFDERYTMARTYYNAGLEKCLTLARKQGGLTPRQVRFAVADGAAVADVTHQGFVWQPQQFNELVLADDYKRPDEIDHHKPYGLGVPLIGISHAQQSGGRRERFLEPRHPFAVTAFLRPDLRRITRDVPAVDAASRDVPGLLPTTPGGGHIGVVELYDPLRVDSIRLASQVVPLETDLAAPMSLVLRPVGRKRIEWGGFFQPEEVQQYAGLYMFEPYRPGKIPLVFVHGLLSGPITWTDLFKDLWADPKIRERYQCWFFLYPTGTPFLDSARRLREGLQSIVDEYGDEDPAVHRMVLVGHSMGGLLSKLQVTGSSGELWSLVSSQSLEEIRTQPQTRELLQGMFFFEPLPAVERVVFIATPHQGSELSQAPIGRLGSLLVRAPQSLLDMQRQLVRDNPSAINRSIASKVPNSVDLLAADNPLLQTMYRLPFSPRVRLHSIAGTQNDNVIGRSALAHFLTGYDHEPGDGVVTLASTRLPQTHSELLVPATHEKVHRHPLAFEELRRILHEHLDAPPPEEYVTPLRHETSRRSPATSSDAPQTRLPQNPSRRWHPANATSP